MLKWVERTLKRIESLLVLFLKYGRKVPVQKYLFRNIHFLCDAIDLKQSVEGVLQVLGNSLKTVLVEVHFIVNLHSSPLPSVPQPNSSYPKVSYFPLPGRTTSKTPSFSRRIDNSLSLYLFFKFEP